MTLIEAEEYIERASWRKLPAGPERMRALTAAVGEPQRGLRFVHAAGTNGKGSVCAMTESILRAAGYRTGLYTSPHLRRITERIRVCGAEIPGLDFAALIDELRVPAEALGGCTAFELLTCAAFLWYARSSCGVVVLETGLGGRLDATNVIESPDCAVITGIGLDHTELLGGDLRSIALEKAGIIKGGPVVSAPQSPEAEDALIKVCAERGSPLVTAERGELAPISDTADGQSFIWRGGEYFLPLAGAHQLDNAAAALLCIDTLRGRGYDIPDSAVERGLAETRWPARFETLGEAPRFITDGGHNPQGAAAAAAAFLRYCGKRRRVILLGVLADKDWREMARLLCGAADAFVTVTPPSHRALPAETLAAELRALGASAEAAETVEEGVAAASAMAGVDGAVLALGSLYIAGDVRACFGRE